MIALIDGDVITYRCGWASENEDEAIACIRANKTVEDILADTGATEYQVWLSDSLENNYRFQIDKNYKIGRQSQPKPKWYWSIKEFLKREWNAQITEKQEADDVLGIQATILRESSSEQRGIICSNDKDLLQIPGFHYNFVTKVKVEQTWIEGIRWFYSQLLIGDRVDDIDGVRGIGPKKAAKLLNGLDSERDMFDKVRYQYQDDERLLKNGRLLWIRRKENEIWSFPPDQSRDENIISDESGEYGNLID